MLDSITKASMIPGCATALKMYTVGVDPNNCATNTSSVNVLEADAKCFDEITTCDLSGTIALGQCLSRAQEGG